MGKVRVRVRARIGKWVVNGIHDEWELEKLRVLVWVTVGKLETKRTRDEWGG